MYSISEPSALVQPAKQARVKIRQKVKAISFFIIVSSLSWGVPKCFDGLIILHYFSEVKRKNGKRPIFVALYNRQDTLAL